MGAHAHASPPRSPTTLLASMLTAMVAAIPGLALPVVAEQPGEPEPSDGDALREELRILRERVEDLAPLEERLRALEAASASDRSTADPPDLVAPKPGTPPSEGGDALALDLGGALRFNYVYRSFTEASRSKGGDIEFDIFRIDVDAEYGDLLASAQYRWYDYQQVLHHGWVGYRIDESLEARVGVTRVPFGLLPYASQSWWFGVPYYLGFEDDYDLGGALLYRDAGWDVRAAFFKNSEYGDPSQKDRYSFDLVTDDARQQGNEETNQVDLRIAHEFELGPELGVEVGLSGEWGQIYNDRTDQNGERWAAAAHLDTAWRRWTFQLETIVYSYDPANPPGVSGETVLLGAYATSFLAPSSGTVLVANLAREFPVDLGPISGVTCYNNYSVLLPGESGLNEVQLNTTGCLVSAGPVATYVDFIAGSGAPFLGVPSEELFRPIADDDWSLRFNVNLGFYF